MMAQAVRVASRHRIQRAEVDHVDRAAGEYARDAGTRDSTETICIAGQHTAKQVIGHFGGGQIDGAVQLPAIDQFFQRSATAAGRVKRQAVPLRLKIGNQRLNAGVVTPNIVRPIAGLSS